MNLHELSHHWFGNQVTMKWWDDLWLNEAFASYISFLVMEKAPEFKLSKDDVWTSFLTSYKFRGILFDNRSTTHPISSEVSSVRDALSIFDGISYGKGASFLK